MKQRAPSFVRVGFGAGLRLATPRSVLALLALTVGGAALVGCSVVLAARQPGKKDVSVLHAGTPRAEVVREFGAPSHSQLDEYGNPVDYFDFVQGYRVGTKVVRAVFHATADVFSLGLWEIVGTPTEIMFDGTAVRLRVAYDENERVDSVTVLEGGDAVEGVAVASRNTGTPADLPGVDAIGPATAGATRFGSGYESRLAVVIGINQYQHWPVLGGAKADAMRVAEKLRGRGFEVIEIYDRDATRKRVLELLGEDLQERTEPESLLVIFFAGHGQTETLPNGQKRGYIIPVDGEPGSVFSTAISMETLRDLSNRLPAKHVYYVMDSCYSGLGFVRGLGLSPSTPNYLEKVTSRRAVQMITAGQEGEVAIERDGFGVFTTQFLMALDGAADLNSDGFITAGEIGAYLPAQVTAETQSMQTPMFGTLEGSGEVVFDGPRTVP